MNWVTKNYKKWIAKSEYSDYHNKLKSGKMTKAEYVRKHGQDSYNIKCQLEDYESMYEYSDTLKEYLYTSKGMTRAEFLAKWGLEALEGWDEAVGEEWADEKKYLEEQENGG